MPLVIALLPGFIFPEIPHFMPHVMLTVMLYVMLHVKIVRGCVNYQIIF